MSNKPLVTILDDVPEIRIMLSQELEAAGFVTRSFSRAADFEREFASLTPDLCILDLGLPDKDGLALVHRLATESQASVMIISGRSMVQDRIVGLELGADDYITKPFDPAEVVARARALLRRGKKPEISSGTQVKFARWLVDFDQFKLTADDGSVTDLSNGEARV